MFHRIISVTIAGGKDEEGTAFMMEAVAYIRERYPDTNAQVWKNRNGDVRRLHIVEAYSTWEAWEATIAELKVDAHWQQLEARSRHLYEPSSFAENFYEVIS